MLHIYSTLWQPLTGFRDAAGEIVHTKARAIHRCHECRDWRTAAKLKILAYYDHVNILCADGCYGQNRRQRRNHAG